ncbi:VWA domain-containing protein [Ectothiorhodospiraceae bacterium 2226]|nr:VWA domain-containing protein [Ectothiorhodospiraceae bacterium 2226]
MSTLQALGQLDWRAPLWLLLALQPWTVWALVRWRRRALHRYAEPHLRPWALQRPGGAGAARFALNALAWLLLAAALAGPRVPAPAERAGEGPRSDVALMVVLDVSPSMYAEDVAPRRLQRARLEVENLLERLRGERVGLVAVAGEALLLAPPTADHGALRHYLARAPQVLADVPGTNLAAALRLAREALAHAGGVGAVVLITDGDADALSGGRGEAALAEAAGLGAADVPLFVLGVGTADGAPVPTAEGYLLYGGETVISRMDEARLRALAQTAGGRYATAGRFGQDWRALYDGGAARLPSAAQAASGAHHWRELFPWLLVPALVMLALSWLRWSWPVRAAAPAAALALALALALQPAPVWADDAAERQAHALYESGNYPLALMHYARLGGYAARMGEGASAYRLRDYEHAAAAFARAWLEAPDETRRAEALFNLGNAQFRAGAFHRAEEAYRDALRYPSPHRERIAANLELARAQAQALDPAEEGVAGRRSRFATEDVARMDPDEDPEFPEDEAPREAATAEDEREALGEAVARGELLPEADGARGGAQRRLAVDREYAAALKKLDLVEDRDVRLLRSLRAREAPPQAADGGRPW